MDIVHARKTTTPSSRVVSILITEGSSVKKFHSLIFFMIGSYIFIVGQQAAGAEDLSGSVTVYTSMRRSVIELLKEGFEAANPGTAINIYRSGTGEVLAKFQAEESAGAIQADILSVADMTVFRKLYAKGNISAYSPKGLEKIPDPFKHENGAYNEYRWSAMSIIYNTGLVKEPLKSWKVLLQPEYKGKIVMADPQYSGTVVATVASLLKTPELGWKFFEDFAANGGKVVKSNGEARKTVASGEFALGIVNDSGAYVMKAKGSPVDYFYPEEGAVLLPQPIAILSNCKNMPLAKAFLDYIYTEKAMRDMSSKGYVSALPGTSEMDVDFGSIKLIETDWDYIDKNRSEMIDTFISLFQ